MLCAARQCIDPVFERREIQVRRHRVLGGGIDILAWIGRGGENAFVEFAILLLDLRTLIRVELLQFVDISADGFGEIAELEREQPGVGQPDDGGADGLRERAAVDEIGVGEMRVPVEIVVNGMINAASAAFSAVAEIDGCDAQMVDEHGVIGT